MANYSQAELQYIASQVHPYLLELVRSNGLDVDSIEVVNDTDGITSLPAYDNRGGTKKVVRVPLSTFSKPAQDAADQLAENIASAGQAAAKANEAATKANAAADEINAVKEDIIQAVEDAQKAVQDSQAALTEVSEKIVEINSSETSRQEAEQSRQNAEIARATEYSSLKNQMETSISEMDVATESALDTANHPTYIGEDNYVYIWNKSNKRYDKTNIYVKGDEGEPGTDGQDPVLTFGAITTLNPGESASASLVSKGVDASGRPVYQLNLSIPRGDKGENGSGSGNVLVSTAGLQSGKTYLFKPNQNESAEGTFVEYEIPQIDTSTLATKTELSQGLAAKQDTINDLETIRSGASKGATALQSVPSEYVTEDELKQKGYAVASDVDENLNTKQDKILKFTNLSASSWVSDSTYSDYPYRCDLQCNSVTSEMYAEVVFSVMQASGGDYAPICETKTNAVSIWSKQNVTISVPTIIITK